MAGSNLAFANQRTTRECHQLDRLTSRRLLVQRLYQRCARCFPGAECYVSRRAFRRLTELPGHKVGATWLETYRN